MDVVSLFALEAALLTFWAIRLVRAGSARKRPALLAYLLAGGIPAWAMVFVYAIGADSPAATHFYMEGWKLTRALYWVLHIALIVELFTELIRPFPGIERLGNMFLRGAAATGAVIGLVAYSIPSAGGWIADSWGRHEAAAYLSFSVVCLGMLWFRRMFPLQPCSNWRAAATCFAAYFFGGAVLSLLTVSLGREHHHLVDLVGLTMADLAIGWGAFHFSRAGEALTQAAPAQSEVGAAAVERLAAINRALEGVAR